MPEHKEEEIPLGNKKAICLIYSYFDKEENISNNENLIKNLNEILEISPLLINYMYTVVSRIYSNVRDFEEEENEEEEEKFFGLECILTLVKFSAFLHQRQGYNSPQFSQLPYFDKERIEKILINNKNSFKNFSILEQINLKEKLRIAEEIYSKEEPTLLCSRY